MSEPNLTVGDVAQAIGFSTHTIKKWEKEGVAPKASRNTNGHRRYTQDDVEALRVIAAGRR